METQEQAQPEPEPQVEAEVELDGPEQVTTGAAFDFTWTGTIDGSDFITIVPADADADTVKNHIRVDDNDKGRLTAPGTPGLYELRYVLEEGRRTLASVPAEVVEAEVGISSSGIVRAGMDVDITWSATINGSDFITIVPAGSDEGKVETHIRTRDATEGRMKAPETVGLYEIRYVLEEGRRTLASASLEVVATDAPLDDGAGLDVPASARPGDVITVSWTGGSDGADQRISLARADQPDFSWIAAHKVGTDKTFELKVPEEAGSYEVRYLDISGRRVLGRAIVEVK
jgi:Ca-activated chloride channel family protein